MVRLSVEHTGMKLDRIFEIPRYCAFGGFCVLCLWLVSAYLYNAPPVLLLAGSIAVVGIAVLSWWNILWSLCAFIICIPLVSGLCQTGLLPVSPLSFWFACIYLTWLTKKVFFDKKSIRPQSIIGNLIDTLSAVVVISLIMIMLQYPPDYLLYRLWPYPARTQSDPMFSLFAAFILLQGLFLYRIMELEVTGEKTWRRFIPVFYVHVLTILIFYLVQVVYNVPAKFRDALIYSPFSSVHSWGSYVVLLLFVFWGLSRTKGSIRAYGIVVTILFSCLIFLSSSVSTVAALLITGCIFVARKFGARWFMAFSGVILAGLLLINLYPSILEKSDNYLIERYAKRLIVKTVINPGSPLYGRYMSADQTFGILREYPLTGSGIGTFYRISRYYHYSDKPYPRRIENAHNYYLQFTADLGIPALLLFLSIIFCVYRAGVRAIPRYGEYEGFTTGLLFGLSAYLITMLTDHPLILSEQQFLFWFVIAMISINYQLADSAEVKKGTGYFFICEEGISAEVRERFGE